MARFYADEQFPLPVVKRLRALEHDVLTVQEAGNADQGISDDDVLAFAIAQERAVLTLNRYDFVKLHRASDDHFGIVVCTNDKNWKLFAARIDEAVSVAQSLRGRLLRINRPAQE
ncbi:MAG: DUF5615 family PIN-like protein [Cyanobacteria bacterium P01_F01_bin.53]